VLSTVSDPCQGDGKVKLFRYAEHFRVLIFAPLTYCENLGDIGAQPVALPDSVPDGNRRTQMPNRRGGIQRNIHAPETPSFSLLSLCNLRYSERAFCILKKARIVKDYSCLFQNLLP